MGVCESELLTFIVLAPANRVELPVLNLVKLHHPIFTITRT